MELPLSETKIMRTLQVAASKAGMRLFRNNVGQAWTGKKIESAHGGQRTVTIYPGDVIIRCAHPIKFGLCEGSHDLIGWRTRVITLDMVGLPVAIFTTREIKTASGKISKEQQYFMDAVNAAGGDAKVSRSLDELL
jgi:hypothetical protein